MEFSAKQIAEILQGTIEGNPDVVVSNLEKIEEGKTGDLCFISNPQYNQFIYESNASIVIVSNDFTLDKAVKNTCTLIRVEDSRLAFAKVLEAYHQFKTTKSGISPNAFIGDNPNLGDGVYIGSGASIGDNVTIGKGVQIHSNATIGDNVVIGDKSVIHSNAIVGYDCKVGANCLLQPGVILGGDGFGFAPNSENNYMKVIHIGNVVLENHVEIGANTTIDRGSIGSTIIRKGVKLDNLIQVAHNVEIGQNTVIAAQTGIAGSTKIGRDCMIGGQVGLVGHITIADGVKIAAQSGIGQSIIEKGAIVQGSPAFAIGEYKRSYVGFRSLPKIQASIHNLEKELAELKKTKTL